MTQYMPRGLKLQLNTITQNCAENGKAIALLFSAKKAPHLLLSEGLFMLQRRLEQAAFSRRTSCPPVPGFKYLS